MFACLHFTEVSPLTDVRDEDKQAPLHTACKWGGKKGLVQYLVEEAKCDVGESFL